MRFWRATAVVFAAICAATGCNDYGNTFQGNTGVFLGFVSPSNITAGGPDLTISLTAAAGNSSFVVQTIVTWDQQKLKTCVVTTTAAGVCAGFFGDRVRGPVLALTNVLFAFPPLLLALTLATTLTRNWATIALAIAVVYVPIFVRVTRGPVLSLRETDFIRAARVLGLPTWRILARHILPNISAIVTVQVTLSLSWAVLTEASLSFLGLGSPPPAPSLGAMVFDAKVLATTAWWTLAAPGAVIVIFVVGLNLLGDGLRDALDPRNGRNS